MATPVELFPVLKSLDFDTTSGVELCGGDDRFYCDLIEELYTDVLVGRRTALSGDSASRREYAHLLKGTLQVLGEGRASMKARALEQAIRDGIPHDAMTEELLKDLDKMNDSLATFFGGLPGS